MTEPHQATDLAAATAKVAHGGVESGDNDPEATRALLVDKAIRDRAFPPVGEVENGLAMCAGWGSKPAYYTEKQIKAMTDQLTNAQPKTVRDDVAAVTT